MADDDEDDCLLAQEALAHLDLDLQLDIVSDGEALLNYLRRQSPYESLKGLPLPSLILLDLNMPRKSGLEALREIKSDPQLRRIPIVILTTSEVEDDVYESYDQGANSYITKSVTLTSLVEVVEEIGKYWLEIVELPPETPHRA
jgi:CheY-like chemotaxis protein